MTLFLKQSTAVTLAIGPFVDSADGVTAETALTLTQADFRLSKNGAAFAQKGDATSGTHMENGYYSVPFSTTDTGTLGILKIAVNETGAVPLWADCMVVPANVWDSLFGADQLQVHVNEMTAGIITATVIATDAIDADAIADNAINAGAIATDAITAAKIASDAITEIQSGLATASALTTVDDFLDTEIAAIKAKTDNLPAAPAAVGDIPSAATIANSVWDEPLTQPSGVFAWAGSFRDALNWIGALSRNKKTQTATIGTLRNDADNADIATQTVSNDGTTYTSGEWT